MCIANDFSMYYSESFVGYPVGDVVHPFYVSEVKYSQQFRDENSQTGIRFSEYANRLYTDHERVASALDFVGRIDDQDGGSTRAKISMEDLILDNPELGYIKVGGVWNWVSYTPNKSAKKGLVTRRLCAPPLGRDGVYSLFNIKPSGDLLHRDILLRNGKRLEYKGFVLGVAKYGVIQIDRRFELLYDKISALLPKGLRIQVLD